MEIGGYFGLDLPDYGNLYTDVIKYQSARAAIRAVLECNEISRVMMPAYICSSIFKAAEGAGVAVETYNLNESLYPDNLPGAPLANCAFIYVNYFGLCNKNIERLCADIPNDHLIIDNSHALFASPTNALATIYSPRKFVGLPDGGLLRASDRLNIVPPTEEDQGSFDRMRYLLIRMANSAREGYPEFEKARNSLVDNSPLAMSRLTQRLMKCIPWEHVRERRRQNYKVMAGMMDAINDMVWTLGESDVPLCYPLVMRGCDASKIKNELALRDIFTATYWQDASPRIKSGTIESALINETLFLPIDQRLERAQVETVGRLVLELVKKYTKRNID